MHRVWLYRLCIFNDSMGIQTIQSGNRKPGVCIYLKALSLLFFFTEERKEEQKAWPLLVMDVIGRTRSVEKSFEAFFHP